ncbi:hypothetical protein BJ684DRAFT_20605 [Piptocephalis cylindrospora]|uniref:Uncharacterized protein n=1 Tax=Piptocephalis cylindrospora TaxID=1907219 RepID=A0A4P9Y2F2_9FUNG|nr:hypothetical protein BJ684DRAFT_20605 [Piptocephalis cylindrospora]|eukprot:RKP12874.1 hypothetical protein BJ684DRAFT_20605 [Piptocephalis cylindrospora]
MSFFQRNLPGFIAVGVGVISGFYLWKPSLDELRRMNEGKIITDRSQIHSAAVPFPEDTTEPQAPEVKEEEKKQ